MPAFSYFYLFPTYTWYIGSTKGIIRLLAEKNIERSFKRILFISFYAPSQGRILSSSASGGRAGGRSTIGFQMITREAML